MIASTFSITCTFVVLKNRITSVIGYAVLLVSMLS